MQMLKVEMHAIQLHKNICMLMLLEIDIFV